ncbi:MAG: CoA-binding protein [Acidobacteria bacterium]|nr:CoA-binding protein [Acidobacteriota bacterium]
MKTDSVRPYVVEHLEYALNPRSVAVVGASRDPQKVGYKVVQGLKEWNYQGRIIPVNPRADMVQGFKAYRTLMDIPGEVDLAFLTVPASAVKAVLSDCVQKQVKVVTIASSGFKEAGQASLQDELTRYCRAHKLPLIGPNLLGMGNPYSNFNCGFIPYLPTAGTVAMISQSGANLLAALGASQISGLGMSFFVGLGNKADVDFSEFIAYAGKDPHTRCVSLYIEGLDSEEAFVEACTQIVPSKPVVVIKAGRSENGQKAAFAHTASENSRPDSYYDELFARAGVIRALTWEEFLDYSIALGLMPPLRGDRVVMITNGGGSGLLASDAFDSRGMPLRELKSISGGLQEKIRAFMPPFGSPLNPVDIAGTANEAQYRGALTEAIFDPNIDGVLVSTCPTAVTNVSAIVDVILDLHQRSKDLNKPIVAEFQGGEECRDAILRLRKAGIPAYLTPERAVRSLVALRKYASIREAMSVTPPEMVCVA